MAKGASSARVACARKSALIEDIKAAMADLIAIHNREVEALLAGDLDKITDLLQGLQAARNQKDALMELYREHVKSHGC
jgi:hypothetical protein